MSDRRPPTPRRAAQPDYRMLAELRYLLRRFLRVREIAAREAGVEPQQYLLLLQIKAVDDGEAPTMSHLAERLQIRHHAAVQLVDRLADRGMVERRREARDRREVTVRLRPAGEQVLRRLASYSVEELTIEGPALVASLRRLIGRARRAAGRSAAASGRSERRS